MADAQDSSFRANQVEQKSRITMVNQAIQLLSPDDAKVITLFYKGEQSLDRDRPYHGHRSQHRKSEIAPRPAKAQE